MLVLTRRADESILIGHDVEITILQIKGGQVKIGISAPRDINVHRSEVYATISNQAADNDKPNAMAVAN